MRRGEDKSAGWDIQRPYLIKVEKCIYDHDAKDYEWQIAEVIFPIDQMNTERKRNNRLTKVSNIFYHGDWAEVESWAAERGLEFSKVSGFPARNSLPIAKEESLG